MLSHFSVKNYKCLADVSLPLTPIHVLIGQNDTGKTSLFEAIRTSTITAQKFDTDWKTFREVFAGEWNGRELVWLKAPEPQCSATLTFDETTKNTLGVTNLRIDWRFENTHLPVSEDSKKTVDVGISGVWIDGHDTTEHSPSEMMNQLKPLSASIRKAGGVPIFRLSPRIMSRPSGLTRPPKHTLDEDGFGLPALLDEIKDYDVSRFVELETAFKKYFPKYLRIRLETAAAWARHVNEGQISDHRNAAIGKQVWLATRDGDIRLQQASDGAVILLGFLAMMYSPAPPALLLVEEPENGIHPERLIEVAKLLRQFVDREENAPQIILTTHSPYLLSQFKPEEVTLMRRQPDGSAKAFPLRNAKHIQERMGDGFYLGELWYNLNEEDLLK